MIATQNLPLSLAKMLTYTGGGWGVIAAWLSLLVAAHIPITYLFYGLFLVVPWILYWFFGKVKTMSFPDNQHSNMPLFASSLLGSIGCLLFFVGGFMLVRMVMGGETFEEGKGHLQQIISLPKVFGFIVFVFLTSFILKNNNL